MGGTGKRRHQRLRNLREELQDVTASKVDSERPDAELFVIDNAPVATGAAAPVRGKRESMAGSTAAARSLAKRHDASTLMQMVEEGRRRVDLAETKRKRRRAVPKSGFDLWNDTSTNNNNHNKNDAASKTCGLVEHTVAAGAPVPAGIAPAHTFAKPVVPTKLRRPTVAVELPAPGQSYLPDAAQHQDTLGEALAIELRRRDAEEEADAPIGGGEFSEETLAILRTEEELEDDDLSEDEDEENELMSVSSSAFLGTSRRRSGKLTTAQRNRQRRVKAEARALEKRRAEKKFLGTVGQHGTVLKELRKHEREREQAREERRRLLEEREAKPLGTDLAHKGDAVAAASLPVALSHELNESGDGTDGACSGAAGKGNLRRLRPKGSLVSDRVASMVDRKLMNAKKSLETRKQRVSRKRRKIKVREHPIEI